MSDHRELRTDRRVATELPIRIASLDSDPNPFLENGTTTGLSCSGLSFICPINLTIDRIVRIELPLPGGGYVLKSDVKVVRIVSRDHDDDGIEFGVRFEPQLQEDALNTYIKSIDITPLLDLMIKRGATHLYLSANAQPQFRINRELTPAINRVLSAVAVESLAVSPLNSARLRELRRHRQIEFMHVVPGVGRWRVNVYYQRGQIEATFHAVSTYIRDLDELGLPPSVADLLTEPRGLVIITGHRGSGKSSTVAAMIDSLNRVHRRIIVSIEDTIEFIHTSGESIVQQREIGQDAHSTESALRFALRQDPDVIVLHSVTCIEVMELALHAAETGRLVIAIVPAMNVYEAIQRVENMYSEFHRDAARALLAGVFQGIIAHTLLPRIDGTGSILAPEVLLPNEGTRGAIRSGNLTQLRHVLTTEPGAQSLDVSLRNLILRGSVDREMALNIAHDKEHLTKMLADYS